MRINRNYHVFDSHKYKITNFVTFRKKRVKIVITKRTKPVYKLHLHNVHNVKKQNNSERQELSHEHSTARHNMSLSYALNSPYSFIASQFYFDTASINHDIQALPGVKESNIHVSFCSGTPIIHCLRQSAVTRQQKNVIG
jgi:hypothetical protein